MSHHDQPGDAIATELGDQLNNSMLSRLRTDRSSHGIEIVELNIYIYSIFLFIFCWIINIYNIYYIYTLYVYYIYIL